MIDIDKTNDEVFIDFYRKIPVAKEKEQETLLNFIPKKYGEKRTYTQDWKAYDLAKTNEVILFKDLLSELLLFSDLRNTNNRGFTTKDKIFCATLKIYSNSSFRKTEGLLKEAFRLGYISKVPTYKSISNFMNDELLPSLLDELITKTTLPLIHLEKVGAIDSSGFSISKYEQWNNYKWGKKTGKEKKWMKAHILCGCNTNIILSVKLSEKNVGDSPVFPMLVEKAKVYYDIKEICADKAYSSRKNLDFAHNLGMIPFIPFKSNTNGKNEGCAIWGKMYRYFKNNEEEFNRHYHKRSNVETCFHMLKQKFGSNLSTKSFVSNGSELKLKVLCHNICILIEEFFKADVNLKNCEIKKQLVKQTVI